MGNSELIVAENADDDQRRYSTRGKNAHATTYAHALAEKCGRRRGGTVLLANVRDAEISGATDSKSGEISSPFETRFFCARSTHLETFTYELFVYLFVRDTCIYNTDIALVFRPSSSCTVRYTCCTCYYVTFIFT